MPRVKRGVTARAAHKKVIARAKGFRGRRKNVFRIANEAVMRAGRARWKIENETFNTLKNQGYNFEHNYGHGKQNLATILALLMFLAFTVDQMIQRCWQLFRQVRAGLRTKVKLWDMLRSLFKVQLFPSMDALYRQIADLYDIQLC